MVGVLQNTAYNRVQVQELYAIKSGGWNGVRYMKLNPYSSILLIPVICQFWYTTALFRPVKVHQMNEILQKNSPNWPKFSVL